MSAKPLTPFIRALLEPEPQFTTDDLATVLDLIFTEKANDIEIASFLTALRLRRFDFKAEYIAIAVDTVLKYSDCIPDYHVEERAFVDIVGTGGDSQNTFNVSTSTAIVTAGMGINVCKHGGKAATSSSGAGDLMNKLGVDLAKVNASTAPKIVADSKLCFLFAPTFHHGMAKVANVRRQLGIPTIFNILGPLLNPINIRARILGVYTRDLGRTFCEAAVKLDRMKNKKANTMVVWGEVGLDKISPLGKTQVWFYNKETDLIEEFELSPADFGLPEHSLDLVKSGTPEENAATLTKILDNECDISAGENALADYILMNASALAVISGSASDWKEGVKLARESIVSGNAKRALATFIQSIERHS